MCTYHFISFFQHADEFDALSTRIEALQDNLKEIRSSLVLEVRSVRVSGFGEETQEFRLLPRGGRLSGGELRLRPLCGNSLKECICGGASSSSPPGPARKGSLAAAIRLAREAAADIVDTPKNAATQQEESARDRGEGDVLSSGGGCGNGGAAKKRLTTTGAGARKAKRRRVLNDESDDDDSGGGGLDEIKRQMGKDPLDLERSKRALEEEIRVGEGRRGHHQQGRGKNYSGQDSVVSAQGGFASVSSAGEEAGGSTVGRERVGDQGTKVSMREKIWMLSWCWC